MTHSFSGGVGLVLPTGVWEVLAIRRTKGVIDPMKIGEAVVEAKAKK